MKKTLISALLLCAAFVVPGTAFAHTLSNSYLSLVVQGRDVSGQWDIAIRDLEYAVGVDANEDGTVTWGELKAQRQAIEETAMSSLSLTLGNRPVSVHPDRFLLDYHSDGAYAVILFSGQADAGVTDRSALAVRYNLFFDVDPQHRGLLNLQFKEDTGVRAANGYGSANGLIKAMLSGQKASAVFDPVKRDQSFSRDLPTAGRQVLQFFHNGVWHIWSGYDHISFLLVLLLPAVLFYRKGKWESIDGLWPIFLNTVKIVTAFSLAHSITLTLAATGLLRLPSRLVESTIAASIVWGAVNNFYPRAQGKTWMIAFCFGLMHGFGFASALEEFGLTRGTLLRAVLSFNLGVEAGQLAIVCAFLPVAYALRKTRFYRDVVLRFGSLAIGALGMVWLIQRVFNLNLISFGS